MRKDCLQLAELEELLPVFVHFLLDLFDHPLVAGLEHVAEPALEAEVLLHRALVLGLIAQVPFSRLERRVILSDKQRDLLVGCVLHKRYAYSSIN